jgi:hypothetical protein
MRRSTALAGVLAGAAIGLLALPARAEFSLQIINNPSGDGFKIDENANNPGTFKLLLFGNETASEVKWSASAGRIAAVATIDGYSFNVTGNSNQDTSPTPKVGVTSFNATVTANPGAKATNFSYYVADSPFSFPGTASSTLYLQSALATQRSFIAGDTVRSQATYVSYQQNGKTTGTYVTAVAGPLSGPNQTAYSNTITIPTRGTQYALSGIGGVIENSGHVGTLQFSSHATAALPEPSGVLIGLVGLPCLAVVVFLTRRRRAGAPAAA